MGLLTDAFSRNDVKDRLPSVKNELGIKHDHLDLTRSSAIAERPRCSLFKLWQKYKREKRASGLFFKSPVATESSRALSKFTHYVYASFGHVTCAPCAPYRTHWPYLSVLIGLHLIHPNTSLSSVRPNQH